MKDRKRPKIAIVRGANLNKWEIQNYEPLLDKYELVAYTTEKPRFDLSEIRIPIIKLPESPEFSNIHMPGLEDALVGYDIIFTADITWMYSAQTIVAKHKYGVPVICLEWENIPFAYEDVDVVRRVKKIVREGADFFIAVTERAKRALMLEGISADQIDVIPMGVDTRRFRPDKNLRRLYRERLGIRDEEIIILFVGRVEREKGIYEIIHAIKKLYNTIHDIPFRLLIVGNGPDFKPFAERANLLGLKDQVVVVQSCPYSEMPGVYNVADIMVLPSIPTQRWQEQLGMALIEAMAAGNAVISTYSGSIPEVVGDAGILIQPADHVSLYEALSLLLRSGELRRELGMKALARARSLFDSSIVAEKVSRVFDRVLEAREVKV